jgi:transposase
MGEGRKRGRLVSSNSRRAMESDTFVGLDTHRKVVVATAVDSHGLELRQESFGATDEELKDFLRGLPGRTHVALEASTVWEHFFDAAASVGSEVTLSHPRKTRLIAEASLKSDHVDSEALATLLRLDALPRAYAPPEPIRELRRIVRDWVFYSKKRRAVMSHVYGAFLQKGIAYEDGVRIRKAKREDLRTLKLSVVDRGLDLLVALDEIRRDLEKALHVAFLGSADAQLLSTIPGIGEFNAVALTAFLCPISRFENLDQVASYCGLCPTNYQSASTSYQGALKPDCNRSLRWVLIEASWSNRRYEKGGDVSRVGKRIARRKGKPRGAVSAAHKLLRIAVAVLRRGTPYTHHTPERQRCKMNPAGS